MFVLSMLQVQVKAACDVEMKIDEKVLAYFESCNSPVDKEGYLHKKVRCFHVEVDHMFGLFFCFFSN